MEFEEAELCSDNYKLVISCAVCIYKFVLTSMFLRLKILSFDSDLCYLILSDAPLLHFKNLVDVLFQY